MVRKIEFQNFMSLKDVTIDLDPLTIFVGPNAAGKSAIFKGLVALSRLLGGVPVRSSQGEFFLEYGVNLNNLVWGGDTSLPIRFRVWFADDLAEPGYFLELSKQTVGWSVTRERIRSEGGWIEVDQDHPFEHPTDRGHMQYRPPLRATLRYLVHHFRGDADARPAIAPILGLSERFGQAYRYRPSAYDIAAPFPLEEKSYVRENGRGLPAELSQLLSDKRDVFDKIQSAVVAAFPHIKRINLPTDTKREKKSVRINFVTERSGEPIVGSQESDGALLATFLYWRLHTASPSLKICLEEPENGLHPYLLGKRFSLLDDFAQSKENPVQILVATHSPYLLRVMHTSPKAFVEKVRLVEFQAGSGTSVRRMKLSEVEGLWKQFLDDAIVVLKSS